MSALRNPVLLLTLALPAAAVLASVATTIVALSHGDAPLPEQYHWEGVKLDRDFSRAQRAEELGVTARVEGLHVGGKCTLHLQSGAAPSETVSLALVHATMPDLDQKLVFRRTGAENHFAIYHAPCRRLAEGHWRLELEDPANGWALRRMFRGAPETIVFDTRDARDS